MNNLDYKDFEKNDIHVLKQAQFIASMNVTFYLIISLAKIIIGNVAKSTALKADGYNGATDTLAYLIIIMGIAFAKRPKNQEHRFGYAKAETVSTLITSILIIETSFWIIWKGTINWISNSSTKPDSLAAIVGISCGIMTFIVFLLNKYFAQKIHSKPLLTSSKDQKWDGITAILTGLAIVLSDLGFPWLDKLTAIVIGLLMLRTGLFILNSSAFKLIDGFSNESLSQVKLELAKFPQVERIVKINGREYENDIYISAIVKVDSGLTVSDTMRLTKTIQNYLQRRCGIFELDIQYVT
ncbi:cation transporter [Companilactobacillus zhachilii]|uniref:cation diffusion facilitator family transporter n=1 Tax=Companilactobacillus zhachilii TaxID=2304606 RepID=UPI0019230B1C|nr:cation diffusion facilitator family transporter [Companilactobacillus zhachilii]MBL3530286.1 cation transporter [Companilactobacillus zhachilii]